MSSSTFDLKSIGLNLKSNIISSNLEFDVTNDATIQMYDANGKLIKEDVLVSGYQNIDVSDLSSGMYIVNCSNIEGKKATVKIVKK